ncbi:esterase-like activity of phytase family protein [Sphingomonas guangdongensis]|uniref:esterase-like activity of phytase family protein n=1 Tax=Sphingomonas guangdongensis TaxID=1141890 RepID=UPI0015C735C7|nr:esterase-like activity of phytase family protein [Sphingomonas guangdongensis]
MRLLLVVLLVLVLLPTWTDEEHMPRYAGTPEVRVRRLALDERDPARTRLGALDFLGSLQFRSGDRAFGGFSALAVSGRRFTLLSDGGLLFGFSMGPDLNPRNPWFGVLPRGPGRGWSKRERDSESLALGPDGRHAWVGFERDNAVWRYSGDFRRAEASRRPLQMRRWDANGGAEALVRLRDGSFLVFAESVRGDGGSPALRFDSDPTEPDARVAAFTLVPPAGYEATDAAELPDGRVVVLTRRLQRFPPLFTAKLMVVERAAIRAGARVEGREIATFAPPVLHDNLEGLAITREGGNTIVWIASDDNTSRWQRTLLLKFRLRAGA